MANKKSLSIIAVISILAVFGGCTLFTSEDSPTSVEAPTIDIESGTYAAPQTVILTSPTTGATIKYTTDDSDPLTSTTFEIGEVGSATATATVANSLTLKAYAYMSGKVDSGVTEATYIITSASAVGPDYAAASLVYPVNVVPAGAMQGSFRISNVSVAGTSSVSWAAYISSDSVYDAGDTEIDTGSQAALAVGETSGVITYIGAWPANPTGYYIIITLTAADELVTGNNTVVSGLIPLAATGRFVAVGDSGNVIYSDDAGASWTPVADADIGAADLTSVALDGDSGRLVAVGASTIGQAVAFYSDDSGENWTPSTVTISEPINEVTWGKHSTLGGRFVAVANGKIIYSADPSTTWTVSTANARNYADVAFGGDTFSSVPVQLNIAVYNTDAGAAWTDTTGGINGTNSYLLGITYAATRFVAAGSETGGLMERFYYSADGITWTIEDPIGVAVGSMRAVAYDGTALVVAAGDNGRVWFSTDEGANWNVAAGATLPDSELKGVAYGDSVWIVVGSAVTGNIWRTTNVAGAWTSIAESVNTLRDILYIP